MNYDDARIEEAVLALLAIFSFDGGRAWKGFEFDVLNRLHAHGFIENPVGKQKSVCLTEKGLERGRELAKKLFSAE
jgi:hypothetical protein